MNREILGIQAELIANIHWITEKAREFQKKTSTFALLTMPKPLCGSQQTEKL